MRPFNSQVTRWSHSLSHWLLNDAPPAISAITANALRGFCTCLFALSCEPANIILPMLGQCWASVVDGGPASNQHWENVPYLQSLAPALIRIIIAQWWLSAGPDSLTLAQGSHNVGIFYLALWWIDEMHQTLVSKSPLMHRLGCLDYRSN